MINYSYFFVLSIKDLIDQSIVIYYVLTALSYCNQKLFVNLNQMLHLYAVCINRVRNLKCVIPTLSRNWTANFVKVLIVNKYLKSLRTSTNCNPSVIKVQHNLNLIRVLLDFLKLRVNSTLIICCVNIPVAAQT